MTRQWGRYRHLGLLAVTLTAGCGAHLEAVQMTGSAGQHMSSADVIASAPALCLEIASLSGASDDCSALRDEARAWTRVVELMEAYGRALAVSGHGGALSPAGLVGGFSGLKPDDAAAATALAGFTRELYAHRQDGAALRRAIADGDAPLQKLAQGLESAIDRRVSTIDLAETSIDVVRQRLQEVMAQPVPARPRPPPASAPAASPPAAKRPDKAAARADDADLRPSIGAIAGQLTVLGEAAARQAVANQTMVPGSLAGLAAVQNDLESRRGSFLALKTAVGVFARAHKALHDNVNQLDPDALVSRVLGAIEDAGANPAAKPAPAHP